MGHGEQSTKLVCRRRSGRGIEELDDQLLAGGRVLGRERFGARPAPELAARDIAAVEP